MHQCACTSEAYSSLFVCVGLFHVYLQDGQKQQVQFASTTQY